MYLEECEFEQFISEISNICVEDNVEEQINHIKTIYNIDDINKVLKVINSINKTKIKNLINKLDKSNKQEDITFELISKDDIEKIFNCKELNEIEKEYTKKELKNMYNSLFGTPPLSTYNKPLIIKNIDYFFKSKKRVKDIEKSYGIKY